MHDTPYLNDLCEINASLETCSGKLRETDVFCIDKYDREIIFDKPDNVLPHIQKLLSVFSQEYREAKTKTEVACALAKFYYGIIVIHPFDNGNRRTAFAFMKKISYEKLYELQSLELLQKILFEGDVNDDMKKLAAVFYHMLQPLQEQGIIK